MTAGGAAAPTRQSPDGQCAGGAGAARGERMPSGQRAGKGSMPHAQSTPELLRHLESTMSPVTLSVSHTLAYGRHTAQAGARDGPHTSVLPVTWLLPPSLSSSALILTLARSSYRVPFLPRTLGSGDGQRGGSRGRVARVGAPRIAVVDRRRRKGRELRRHSSDFSLHTSRFRSGVTTCPPHKNLSQNGKSRARRRRRRL